MTTIFSISTTRVLTVNSRGPGLYVMPVHKIMDYQKLSTEARLIQWRIYLNKSMLLFMEVIKKVHKEGIQLCPDM